MVFAAFGDLPICRILVSSWGIFINHLRSFLGWRMKSWGCYAHFILGGEFLKSCNAWFDPRWLSGDFCRCASAKMNSRPWSWVRCAKGRPWSCGYLGVPQSSSKSWMTTLVLEPIVTWGRILRTPQRVLFFMVSSNYDWIYSFFESWPIPNQAS